MVRGKCMLQVSWRSYEEWLEQVSGKDHARFLRIALESCRESRGWYYRGRHVFVPDLIQHRMNLATEIMINLTVTAQQQ